jgi:hypothetical protein
VAPLHADHRRDASGGGDPLDVVGRPDELEPVGVAADHVEERVDLLERQGHGTVGRQVGGHVHRPELAAHAALGHARQVGHEGRVGRIAALSKLPQQVVVAVDQRSGAKEVQQGGSDANGPAPAASAGIHLAHIKSARARDQLVGSNIPKRVDLVRSSSADRTADFATQPLHSPANAWYAGEDHSSWIRPNSKRGAETGPHASRGFSSQ